MIPSSLDKKNKTYSTRPYNTVTAKQPTTQSYQDSDIYSTSITFLANSHLSDKTEMPRTDEAEHWFNAVYAAVREIPRGKVTSYGHIALLLGERPYCTLVHPIIYLYSQKSIAIYMSIPTSIHQDPIPPPPLLILIPSTKAHKTQRAEEG